MLNICITFDYELFFGENNGTYEEILFHPTYELTEMLQKQEVSATFFADVCSVSQAKRYGQTQYVKDFEKQLLWLNRYGQDIQLHIHPHWLRSRFKENKWKFDQQSYRIHSFGFERSESESAYTVIMDGKSYLEELIRKQDDQYQCIAYRAGGFCIQPHSELVRTLYNAGIRIDSSVAPHLKSVSETNHYDFAANIPGTNWWIDSENEWNVNASAGKYKLYEVPIGTENNNILKFVAKRLFDKNSIKLSLEEKRGSYINETDSAGISRFFSVLKYLCGYHALSMDAYRAEYLYSQLKRFYKKHAGKEMVDEGYICLIGHPKLVTKEYIDNLKKLMGLLKGDEDFKVVNIFDVYQTIKKECKLC